MKQVAPHLGMGALTTCLSLLLSSHLKTSLIPVAQCPHVAPLLIFLIPQARLHQSVLHLEGDIRVSLSEAQWAVIQDLTLLLKPFMVAQKLLEGESYVTISLIPFMLYKIQLAIKATGLSMQQQKLFGGKLSSIN